MSRLQEVASRPADEEWRKSPVTPQAAPERPTAPVERPTGQVDPQARQQYEAALRAANEAKQLQAAATAAIMLAIKTLSQRAFIALISLFRLATAGAVAYLFYLVHENPTANQLIMVSLFSVFVLALNFLGSRKE